MFLWYPKLIRKVHLFSQTYFNIYKLWNISGNLKKYIFKSVNSTFQRTSKWTLMSPLLCSGKKTTRFLYSTILNSNVKKDNTPYWRQRGNTAPLSAWRSISPCDKSVTRAQPISPAECTAVDRTGRTKNLTQPKSFTLHGTISWKLTAQHRAT